jgi:acyl-CoA synthetase (AMP-forming)/AMP-acid ligase II
MPFTLSHVGAHLALAHALIGNAMVLQRSFEPHSFLSDIARHRAAGSPIAPTMLAMLLRPEFEHFDVSSVETLIYGSSGIAPELLLRAMTRFQNASFYQGFGMTETAGTVTWLGPDEHKRGASGEPALLRSCGRAAPLAAVRTVRPDGSDCATGEAGEIMVAGDQVMQGYWDDHAATSVAMAGPWLCTGDIGYLDSEGRLYVVDRKKDVIVTGGENVASVEVERALSSHPAIAEVAVIGVPDPTWGERVCAVIVVAAGEAITEAEVIAHARAGLASFKKPTVVRFVSALPKTALGKVVKAKLREEHAVAGERLAWGTGDR